MIRTNSPGKGTRDPAPPRLPGCGFVPGGAGVRHVEEPPGRAYRTRSAALGARHAVRPWREAADARTDKLAIAYQAALHLAGILIWTRR